MDEMILSSLTDKQLIAELAERLIKSDPRYALVHKNNGGLMITHDSADFKASFNFLTDDSIHDAMTF